MWHEAEVLITLSSLLTSLTISPQKNVHSVHCKEFYSIFNFDYKEVFQSDRTITIIHQLFWIFFHFIDRTRLMILVRLEEKYRQSVVRKSSRNFMYCGEIRRIRHVNNVIQSVTDRDFIWMLFCCRSYVYNSLCHSSRHCLLILSRTLPK